MDDRFRLAPFPRIHIVGVAGAGMSGLAKLLAGAGHEVSGSDLKPSPVLDILRDLGVEVWVGHRPQEAPQWDLVVASSAVPNRDPELRAAEAAGVAVWRRPALLGAMTESSPAVGFAGTHGKTTSTALAVEGVRACGLDPSFLVGGEMVALNTGAHVGTTDPFLLEADEAFGTFRHLTLRGLLVTNVEPDHLDHYGNVAALEEAFAQVANATAGPVVACIDDPGVRRLAQRVPLVGYGTADGAQWRINDVAHAPWSVSFTLAHRGGGHRVEVPRPGAHVALNAAGVLALLGELGFDLDCIVDGFAAFSGVRRRFEVRGRVNGIEIVEDYAHHPTEVAATIEGAKLGCSGEVWVVFQPHRYSRTVELAPFFGEPLAAADRVLVTDVYAAGEPPIPGVSGRLVAEAAAAAGATVEYVPRLDDVPSRLIDTLEPGDLVLLLGAGDVASIADPLIAGIAGLE